MLNNFFRWIEGKSRTLTYVVFALIIKLFLVAFLALIYWSSALQEERMHEIMDSLNQIQEEIHTLKTSENIPKLPVVQEEKWVAQESAHVDSSLPNLLIKDPFFSNVLPNKLLPKGFVSHGTLRLAEYGKPEHLLPFSNWANVTALLSYCRQGAVALQFGKYEVLAQGFAEKVEERQGIDEEHTEFWVHLRPNLHWAPLEARHFPRNMHLSSHFTKKHPLTAYDFQFWWDALHNPYVDSRGAVALRQLLRDIEKVKAIDDHTLVVIAKRSWYVDEKHNRSLLLPYDIRAQLLFLQPLASFVYQYFPDGTKICPLDSGDEFYQKNSIWAQNFATHFASHVIPSCGPWVFDGMSERQIRFRRNPDFYDAFHALYEAIEIYFVDSPESIWRDFIAKKIDLCTLTPNTLVELQTFLESSTYKQEKARGNEICKLDYYERLFTYIGWNEKNPLFISAKVRRALTLAIDRKRIIEQNLYGQGTEISGPFFCYSTAYDKSILPLPFDPEEAKRLLQEEGFVDLDGDGIIEKKVGNARIPFRFTLTFYIKNPTSKANCEFVATQLRAVGIDCILNGVDTADLSAALDNKSFDALYLAWVLGVPPEDPRQIWHSEGANSKGSSNAIGFANKEVDALIERLVFESDPKTREELYHKIHQILCEEAPYVFLYTPKNTLVYWNWIENIFIPKDRQDLTPGADVETPNTSYTWVKKD